MRDGVVVDVETWPVVRFEFNGRIADSDWLGIYESYERLYARDEPFAVLNDSSRIENVPSAQSRRTIAVLTKQHEPRSRRYVIHSAVVVPNPIARGALVAMNWLAPPVYPQTVHAGHLEALDAIVAALDARGRAVGPKVRAYREKLAAERR